MKPKALSTADSSGGKQDMQTVSVGDDKISSLVSTVLRGLRSLGVAALATLVTCPSAYAGDRPDICSFLPAKRAELAALMASYINSPVIIEHLDPPSNKHRTSRFLVWHRRYIKAMEDYLISQNRPEFVPLPSWNPITAIPAQFSSVDLDCPTDVFLAHSCNPLANLNPSIGLPASLSTGLCSQFVFDNGNNTMPTTFRPILEHLYHDGVHITVGGAMGGFKSPSAPIFWLWHAFVDDVWFDWQCICGHDEGNAFASYTVAEQNTNLSAGIADAWMRDAAVDLAKEPDNETNVLWESPDIWVRNGQAAPVGSTRFLNEHQHENPEYADAIMSRPYIYVKVRNRGCAPISGQLRVYWANASVGLTWPNDFDEVGTSPVTMTSIGAGREHVAELHWDDIPQPSTQAGNHFCLVARFVATPTSADPINGEATNVSIAQNVKNSNQIVWKNLTIVDNVANKHSIWDNLGAGMDESVRAMTAWDDGGGPGLYAGGLFETAGGIAANHIAKWSGASWAALGSGMNAPVHALAVFDGGGGPALYAGGGFTTAGGGAASRIAKWSVTWGGSSWSSLGQGTNGDVRALVVFDDGGGPAMYAGGSFTLAGAGSANRIAKWDGASWAALGSGMNNVVNALTVYDDGAGPQLYAAGAFTTAGGVAASRIAKWNGSSWAALGGGLNNAVNALIVYDDGGGAALHAGGVFTTAGALTANRIAKWNGSSWVSLGTGMNGAVNALAVFDDGSGAVLSAGGDFTAAGGLLAGGSAKWNGLAWSVLGSGVNSSVHSLAEFDDGTGPALYAGGDFGSAGGVTASHVAKWDGPAAKFLVRNVSPSSSFISLGFDSPLDEAGDSYFDHGPVRVNLGSELFARWLGNGAMGTGIQIGPVPNTVLVLGLGASIDGLPMAFNEEFLISVQCGPLTTTPCEDDRALFNLRVILSAGSTVLGGNTYEILPEDVLPSPAVVAEVIGTQVDCTGGGVLLQVTSGLPGGASVQWFRDDMLIPGAQNPLYPATQSGRYSVLMTYGNGCDRWSVPLDVIVTTTASNDNPIHATVATLGVPVPYDIFCATSQVGEVTPGVGSGPLGSCSSTDGWCATDTGVQNSVWFTFTAPASGKVNIHADPSHEVDHSHLANTQLAVWSVVNAGNYGTYTLVAANDDSGNHGVFGTAPALHEVISLTPGTDYYVQLDGHLGAGGAGELVVEDADTGPPTLTCPSSVPAMDRKSSLPGEVVFFSVTAIDDSDPSPSVVCLPPSGSFFPRGTTIVTCTATDASGKQSVCTFPVIVQPPFRKETL